MDRYKLKWEWFTGQQYPVDVENSQEQIELSTIHVQDIINNNEHRHINSRNQDDNSVQQSIPSIVVDPPPEENRVPVVELGKLPEVLLSVPREGCHPLHPAINCGLLPPGGATMKATSRPDIMAPGLKSVNPVRKTTLSEQGETERQKHLEQIGRSGSQEALLVNRCVSTTSALLNKEVPCELTVIARTRYPVEEEKINRLLGFLGKYGRLSQGTLTYIFLGGDF